LARLVGDTEVKQGQVTTPFGDTIQGISVKVGDQMPDWKKWELIKKFREEMEKEHLTVHQVSGTELHGFGEARRPI